MPNLLPDLVLTDHWFDVPLHHKRSNTANEVRLQIYAREVTEPDQDCGARPWLVYFQGGPGYGAPRPLSASGWLGHAVKSFRVLLLDQRGTGLSTPMDATSLAAQGDAREQAEYLKCFRADSIVKDAELIRHQLSPERPWHILGQSFGGFCALNYLSSHPEGLASVMITGGIPPIGVAADDIYRATYQRVLTRNERYYARYPQDVERVQEISAYLRQHKVHMPGGSLLTPQVLQLLGLSFGFSDGFETVHYLLEEAFIDGPQGKTLSFAFLQGVEHALPFDKHPIFSILHEALYCEGSASNWSAQRVRGEYPQFDPDGTGPLYFTGEMIYPWMFQTFERLRPLQAAAEQLAACEDWPVLYDAEVLSRNQVPTAAAVFAEDIYVEAAFSKAVAERTPNMQAWVTPEWDHNALRADSDAIVFKRLLQMLDADT